MILTYNCNGLRTLDIRDSIKAIADSGYDGIELSLHESHLHPYYTTEQSLTNLNRLIKESGLIPVCLSTGFSFLLGPFKFEPSLITDVPFGRKIRIEVIAESILMAKKLNVPVVCFASGYKPEKMSDEVAFNLLRNAIETLTPLANDEGIVLAIEPEPLMFIQTTAQAIRLIEAIDSPYLRLNIDLGHVVCCEDDYLSSLKTALPYAAHMHIEDIKNRVHEHIIPGKGDIQWQDVFNELNKASYNHAVSVELYNYENCYKQAMDESIAFIKPLMNRA
jgi:sugar phosphate isomerase/epimerase